VISRHCSMVTGLSPWWPVRRAARGLSAGTWRRDRGRAYRWRADGSVPCPRPAGCWGAPIVDIPPQITATGALVPRRELGAATSQLAGCQGVPR